MSGSSGSSMDMTDATGTSTGIETGLESTSSTDDGGDPTDGSNPWSSVVEVLEATSIDDFTVMVGDQTGVLWTYNKGNSAPDNVYTIASASKWATALVVLSLVESGDLDLAQHPGSVIDWWTTNPIDPRSEITVRQLLAMTAGFGGEFNGPTCISRPDASVEECVQTIYTEGLTFLPGESFFYGPKHMQVALLMAMEATGQSWNQLWRERIADPLGMAASAVYNVPSETNPRASAGLSISVADYARMMQAVLAGDLVPDWGDELNHDMTGDGVALQYVPIALPEQEWHYALGHWIECGDPFHPRCLEFPIYSSPGAYGFYPWIDPTREYWAIFATEDHGSIGDPPLAEDSVALMQGVRAELIAALNVAKMANETSL